MSIKYKLGLNISKDSIGWAIFDENSETIENFGIRYFENKKYQKNTSLVEIRRLHRNVRRTLRRKRHRLYRIKQLFIKENIIKKEELSLCFSEKHTTFPWKLRIDALNRKLSNIELVIVLFHLAKKRGFKESEKTEKNNIGKLIVGAKKNHSILEANKYRTIAEMIFKNKEFLNKIKNSSNNYEHSFFRKDIENEIETIFAFQKKFGFEISSDFKRNFIRLFNSQRSFEDGPGDPSIYHKSLKDSRVNLLEYLNKECTENVNYIYDDITKKTLSQLRKVIKEIIRKYNYPNSIYYILCDKIVLSKQNTFDHKKRIKLKYINRYFKRNLEEIFNFDNNHINIVHNVSDKVNYNFIYENSLFTEISPSIKALLSVLPLESSNMSVLINLIETYQNVNGKNISISREPKRKTTGIINEATIRSKKLIKLGLNYTLIRKLVSDISIKDIALTKLTPIYLSDKKTYDLLLEKLVNKENVTEFYKPSKKGIGQKVYKLKIASSEAISGMTINNGLAANGSMVRIDIFKKNNKYYMIPIYVKDISTSLPNKAIVGGNLNSWIDINDSFNFLYSLYPNDYIKIERKNDIIEGYFLKANRSTNSISIYDEKNKNDVINSIGIRNIINLEKYYVTILGSKYKIDKEKRIPNVLNKQKN